MKEEAHLLQTTVQASLPAPAAVHSAEAAVMAAEGVLAAAAEEHHAAEEQEGSNFNTRSL